VEIRVLTALPPADLFAGLGRIDAIFFEASSVQAFESRARRFAFHWLWLGRYLIDEPAEAFVAIEDGAVAGYLVGSLVDPAPRAAFADLDYFKDFAGQTAIFPAHLHVNVAAEARGRGVGERLVGAFERHAAMHGAPGGHVVTGAGMRNVGFYERLGYREAARAPRGAGHVVMLAKRL